VCITSRALDAALAAAAEVSSATGGRVVGIEGEVTSAEGVSRLVARAAEQFGAVDILVNNAGVNIRGSAGDLSEADWDAVIDTNLKGVFLMSRALGPGMCARGWGRVINLSSMLATIGLPGRAPYASSKAGVVGLTRVLALEWAAAGVTVNAICPGPFATDMNRQLLSDPEKYAAFVQKLPVGRWGELHEIKGIVVFLASEASSFMTGAALALDGGWTAQ
jgi:NAD(P)-dependent dehydrogenase (short-subunit alcohol dehydrogenase family)